ncbi:hypothetical protein [uncultured Jannaschia sp.]|uniref:hypothetical protein n=1 Tax=uncultured Jannaschia sp. TaxID=293347 RepID=UPI002621E4D6|nr:hypothetical protein [uncultured Jannaschia sp.]
MALVDQIHDATDHLKVYLLAGTLVAVGVDVAANVSGSMTGEMMVPSMTEMSAPMAVLSDPLALAVKAIGGLIALVGAALYLGNMWCGFVALRALRFRFEERGVILQAGGWSLAFLYVVVSAVIGLAVNAVYLALVT